MTVSNSAYFSRERHYDFVVSVNGNECKHAYENREREREREREKERERERERESLDPCPSVQDV